ncbi:MAG: cadherin-like beta sandwich domain-containing protein, partial [Bacteroidales bacterium]|nr:cadherin-like beta sandwich domain-containing protein [Bacteroidales bacterium]
PAFSPDVFEYSLETSWATRYITIVAKANHDNATVSGDGRQRLSFGANQFEIIVPAEDSTRLVYIMNAYRDTGKPTAVEAVGGLSDVRVYAQEGTIHLSESIGELAVYTSSGLCVYSGQAVVIPVAQPGLYIVRRVADGYSWKVVVR